MVSPSSSASSGTRAPGSGATTRYNYLATRLRNRQITMEEATELFAIMQGMIGRANELAQAAVARSSSAPAPPAGGLASTSTGTPAPVSASDDLLLVGLLAMGAGAGLLAAMSKRIAEGPAAPRPRTGSSATPP